MKIKELCLIFLFGLGIILAQSEKVEFIRTPNGGIQPQCLMDSKGVLHLVYFKGSLGSGSKGNLFYVKKEKGNSDWSTPVRVNSTENSVRRNSAISCPKIAIGKEGRIHVTWFVMRPAGYFYTRTNKEKNRFEPERNLVSHYLTGVEAGAALAIDQENRVYFVWHAGKFSMEERRAVYLRISQDGGKTFSSERRANPKNTGVCACCGLNAFISNENTLYISYRAAHKKLNRHMFLLSSTDQGENFSSSLTHKWRRTGCPVSTTSFAKREKETYVSWETEGQVYFASVNDLSSSIPATGTKKARRKNSVIAVNQNGEVLLVWGEGAGWKSGGTLHWQLFENEKTPTKQKGEEKEIPEFSLPAVLTKPDGNFLVVY